MLQYLIIYYEESNDIISQTCAAFQELIYCNQFPQLISEKGGLYTEKSRIQRMLSFLKDVFNVLRLIIFILLSYFETLIKLIFPSTLKLLDGEIILVTGSASGIGQQICLQLSQIRPGPLAIVCWDINVAENDQLVWKLKQNGIKAFGYTVDVSERLEVDRAAARLKKEVGDVTILINNAGILPCHLFLHHNPKEITRTFEVNVFSQFWTIRTFLPEFLVIDGGNGNGNSNASRQCHIVTICSLVGGLLPGGRNLVPYAASQHAVHGYIESLKYELCSIESQIKFTTVYSNYCDTLLLRNVKFNSRFPSILPLVTPEHVAMKTIEGFRRNSETVYIPSFQTKALLLLFNTCSPKVQRAVMKFLDYNLEPEIRSIRSR